jgi:hypothetical protein
VTKILSVRLTEQEHSRLQTYADGEGIDVGHAVRIGILRLIRGGKTTKKERDATEKKPGNPAMQDSEAASELGRKAAKARHDKE